MVTTGGDRAIRTRGAAEPADLSVRELTRDEERELGWAILNDNCHESRERMILCHLHLVSRIAAKYARRGVPMGELMSRGRDGLVRAVEHFDPAQGFRFSTPASWWIRESMRGAIREAKTEASLPPGGGTRAGRGAASALMGQQPASGLKQRVDIRQRREDAPSGFGREQAR